MSLEADLGEMTKIIAGHQSYILSGSSRGAVLTCTGRDCRDLFVYEDDREDWDPDEIHSAHVALELVKAGIGPLPKGLSVEYGSQWVTFNGLSPVQSDGPVPKVSWYDPSTHKRLVTPWEYV